MDKPDEELKKALETVARYGYSIRKHKPKPVPEFVHLVKINYRQKNNGRTVTAYRMAFRFRNNKLPKGTQAVARIRFADLKWIEAEIFNARKKAS